MSTGWLLLSVLLLIASLFLFSVVVRKLLNVEQRYFSPHSYVNATHEKIADIIQKMTITLIIVGAIINVTLLVWHQNKLWYFDVITILLISSLVSESIRAFMEKRHDDNSNAYKATLAEIIFTAFALFYWFNFIYITHPLALIYQVQ